MKTFFVTSAMAGGLSIALLAFCATPEAGNVPDTKAHPATKPAVEAATQPAPLPLFVGEKPDEWKSYQEMHAYFLDRFVRSDGFGLSRLGRKGDELRFKRVYADGTRYYVSRSVQLISLNGGKTPFVYVLQFIDASKKQLGRSEDSPGPDCENLPKHRPLDQFESDALKELQAGKEVVLTGKGEGRELIGAVRAAASCTKCHQVPENTLLGAFRYPLEDESRN